MDAASYDHWLKSKKSHCWIQINCRWPSVGRHAIQLPSPSIVRRDDDARQYLAYRPIIKTNFGSYIYTSSLRGPRCERASGLNIGGVLSTIILNENESISIEVLIPTIRPLRLYIHHHEQCQLLLFYMLSYKPCLPLLCRSMLMVLETWLLVYCSSSFRDQVVYEISLPVRVGTDGAMKVWSLNIMVTARIYHPFQCFRKN